MAGGESPPQIVVVGADQRPSEANTTGNSTSDAQGTALGQTKGFGSSVKSLSKKLSNSLSFLKRGDSESRADKLRKDIDFTEHTWPAEKVYEYYGSSSDKGLSGAQVLQNREKYGWNRLTPPPSTPWWVKYLMQYANIFMFLLMFGGVLCFVAFGIDQSDLTNLYLGVVLFLVVIISATFGYFTEASADSVMEGFKKLVPKKCKVVRDGHVVVLDAEELVPGDVVELNDGDQVPADMRVMTAIDLKVDNSSLTGESEAQERYPELAKDAQGRPIVVPLEASNLVFYTTIVTSGTGKCVVIGTGDKTVMGQIAGLAMETGSNEQTQFQIEVDIFIKIISVVAILIGIAFILIGIFAAGASAISMIVFAIGIIVGTVPEGLLVTLTVSLALSAKNMYAKNVLVKGMPSVENLGSTTVIASDKTGTLTQNRMTVQHAWYNMELFEVPAAKNRVHLATARKAAAKLGPVYDPNEATFKQLQKVATLCNNSRFILKDPNDDEKPAIDLSKALQDPDFNILMLDCTGDASESALVKCVEVLRNVDEYHSANPKLHEIKFNSTNKWQLSIHKPEDAEGPDACPLLVLKGAPERVIRMCTKIMIKGEEQPLTRELYDQFNTAYETLGGMGERVLGFAYKNLEGLPMDYKFTNKPQPNFEVKGLTFVGLMSLIDPPRDGVPEAVARCKRGGIKVYMVTGDHPVTAQAIARQVGIIDQDKWDKGRAIVVKGDDIREWQDIEDPVARQAKWDWALDHDQIVFARVSPAHKLLIVENCQRRGENVAVTGDGVNDAPALKKANTGVAMGIAGKDVTKEAADMILMDDNFASIVNGVEEGRVIFDNLKKSITYTLASKFPEQIPFLLFVIARFPLPISTILILTIDLGCDMVPAISLAYEKKEADIMSRPPRNPATERLVNRRLISHSYFQIGFMQTASGFLAFMSVMNDYGYEWTNLPGIGLNWSQDSLLCRVTWSSEGPEVRNCGYGCAEPEETINGQQTMYGAYNQGQNGFCRQGCPIPFPGTVDPFIEHTPYGFRGRYQYGRNTGYYTDGPLAGRSKAETAVCGRTCTWYNNMPQADKDYYVNLNNLFLERLAAGIVDSSDPFNWSQEAQLSLILSQADVDQFELYCNGNITKQNTKGAANTEYGFPNRGMAYGERVALPGSFYWWNGEPQFWGNLPYQDNVLRVGQTAYFWGVLVARWADLLICKTRKETIMNQGFRNNVLNFALLFETGVALLITYVPFLNIVWGTRPLNILYLFVGIPFFIFIMAYDELRKFAIRRYPKGWVDQNAYW